MKSKQKKIIFVILGIVVLIGIIYATGIFNKEDTNPESVSTLSIIPGMHCCFETNNPSNSRLTLNDCSYDETLVNPMIFSSDVCIGGSDPQGLCVGGGYECNWQGESTFYCDVLDIIECPRHWSPELGMFIGGCYSDPAGPDFCADDTDPIPTPNCSEDYMRCGLGDDADPNGDVYKCENGNWELKEECTQGCTAQSYNYAYCNFNKFYCFNPESSSCTFWSDSSNGCCSENLEQCNNNALNSEKSCYKFGPDSRGVIQYKWISTCTISGTKIPNIDEKKCLELNSGNIDSLKVFDLFTKDYKIVLNSTCKETSSCKYVENYETSCEKDVSKKIIEDGFKNECQNIVTNILPHIPILTNLIGKFTCSVSYDIIKPFLSDYGLCVAKSNGFMSNFDNLAIYLYKSGVPRNLVIPLVFIISIGIIILLFIIILFTYKSYKKK